MFAYNVYEKQKRESYRETLYMFFLIKRSTNYAITQQQKMDDTNIGYYSSSNWYQLDGDSDKFFCGMGFAKKNGSRFISNLGHCQKSYINIYQSTLWANVKI